MAAEALAFDPMEAIRADYKRLKAHHKMVDEYANAQLARAQKIRAEANAMFDEADLIERQLECLERRYPELCK